MAEPKPSPRKTLVALFVAVLAISFAAIFFRKAAPTHPLIAAGTRLMIASLLLIPWTILRWKKGLISGRVLRAGMVAGCWYALHFGAWVTSLTLTTVAASVTLVTATPLLLATVGLITGKDAPSRGHWMGIGLGLVGLVVIGWADLSVSSDALLGDGLAFIGAAAMAGYLLTCRHVADELEVWSFTGLATGVGALLLFLAALGTGIPLEVPAPEPLAYLVAAALIPQLVGHVLLTWSSRFLAPVVVGTATLGEPVGSTVLAWLWLGEAPALAIMAGCSVTLLGVFVALRSTGLERD